MSHYGNFPHGGDSHPADLKILLCTDMCELGVNLPSVNVVINTCLKNKTAWRSGVIYLGESIT